MARPPQTDSFAARCARQVHESAATARLMVGTLRRGGQVLTAGNGGSAAEAMHMAEELVGRFRAGPARAAGETAMIPVRAVACLLAGLLAAGPAAAQMSMDLTLGPSTYVLGEPIRADVRITNHGGQPFVVTGAAQEPNALFFEIVDRAGETLDLLQPRARLLGELLLAGGETHACAFNLDEWYPLRRNGRFFVQARLRRDLVRYDSAKRVIDIVPGLELARAVQLFADRPDEARTLLLVYLARRQAEFLYLRATDAPGDRVLTTIELGLLLRTTPPVLTISPEGEVTVTHRATQDAFLTTHLRSGVNGLDLIKQERVLDREAVNAMRMQYQEAAGASARQQQQGHWWWWPFGGGADNDKGKAKKP